MFFYNALCTLLAWPSRKSVLMVEDVATSLFRGDGPYFTQVLEGNYFANATRSRIITKQEVRHLYLRLHAPWRVWKWFPQQPKRRRGAPQQWRWRWVSLKITVLVLLLAGYKYFFAIKRYLKAEGNFVLNLYLLCLVYIAFLIIKHYIHRMQLWRTTRSAPGSSQMEARLVRLWCFVLKMLPQKTLALSSISSVLFHCAYELLCFWMLREGIEIFRRSPLRENSGSIFNSLRRRKEVHNRRGNYSLLATFQDRRSQKNRLNDELMWCLVVFQHDFLWPIPYPS